MMIHTFLVVVDVMIEILAKVNKSNGTISVALEFMGINRKAVILRHKKLGPSHKKDTIGSS